MSRLRRLDTASAVHEERDHCSDQKYHKQNLGDAGSTRGDAAEAEHGSYQSDDEKNDSIVKHGIPLVSI